MGRNQNKRLEEGTDLVETLPAIPVHPVIDYACTSSGIYRRSFRQIAEIAIPIILTVAVCTGYSLYQRHQDNLKGERTLNTISGIPSMAQIILIFV